MDVNSNGYTFTFAAVMVVVVAVVLAVVAEGLKPLQKLNVANEKRQNILQSVGIKADAAEAESMYNEYKKEEFILDAYGKRKENATRAPFDVDMLKDYKGGLSSIYKLYKGGKGSATLDETRDACAAWREVGADYPMFVVNDADGKASYVVPMMGTGLWGPVWGYLAISEDGETVVGAIFDHKTETPGLGAEIKEAGFQVPFKGKKIFTNEGELKGVIAKKGGAAPDDPHGVDAISGGTITSNGVNEMIFRTLKIYEPFFNEIKGGKKVAVVAPIEELVADTTNLEMDSVVVDTAVVM
ncbi:MAG: Na+-transporting NADH:ubiquinone oxidoreductase subunit C [Granulosicoccus sp.]|jgi:Na+-transporting NADH:ubiquinone oxidoreductase subunit C